MIPLIEKCSLYKTYIHKEHGWCFSTKPITVNISEVLRKALQPELLSAVRNEPIKDKRDVIKKQLWGITPSSIQEGGRGMKYIKEHSGLIAFDIDAKENKLLLEVGGLDKLKQFLTKIPFTVYCGLSASGTGLWGLFRISHPHFHSQHFNAMSEEFSKVGIEIDQAPKSPASLRFLSFDEDAYYNEDAIIFDKKIVPVIKKAEPLKSSNVLDSKISDNNTSGKDLCEKFNSECTASLMDQILTNFGFNYHGHSGRSYRYIRPGKDITAGLSIDYHEDKRTLFCFSSNVPGLDKWKREDFGWSCSPLTALLIYGFGGTNKADWAKAFNWIKTNLP